MKHNSQSGFSLVSVLVAAGLIGLVAAAMSKLFTNSMKATQSTERRMDIKVLAKNFLENVDCGQTLNSPSFTDDTFQPIVCGSRRNVRLRRKDGSLFPREMGGFEIRAGCRNDSVRVFAKKKDALHNRDEFVDVFGGTSGLCYHYFAALSVCPPGEGVIGQAGAIPVCGSLGNPNNVVTRENRGGRGGAEIVQVFCLPNELRLSCGGSREPNLADNCLEEDCALVGVMPVGNNGCAVGIDGDGNRTNATVYITCLKLR